MGISVATVAVILVEDEDWHPATFLLASLVAGWAASNTAYLADHIDLLLWIDGLVAIAAVWVKTEHNRPWTRSYLALCIAQVVLDTGNEVLGNGTYSGFAIVSYLIFVGQLVTLSRAGGRNVGSGGDGSDSDDFGPPSPAQAR